MEKSSSSVQLVLDTIRPGLLGDKCTPFDEHSVKAVACSLEPANISYRSDSFNRNSCFSARDIGRNSSAGLSYKTVALK